MSHDPNKAASSNTTSSFLLNPFNPNATPADPGPLSLAQKDHFFAYQQALPSGPYGLDPESLWASSVMTHKHLSRNVFHTLQKHGVINKDQGNMIDTRKIGPKFTHQLAEIPARQQKRVVDLLFWWEEEVARLRGLEGERREIEKVLREGVEGERRVVMQKLLERVKGKIRARPSERDERVERDEDELMVRVRGEMGAGGSGPVEEEVLPAYSRT